MFLTTALVGGEWIDSHTSRLVPLPFPRVAGVGTKAGVDGIEKEILDHTGTRTPTLSLPAHSQSLYRPRYPGQYNL
jgi:hypothetical protein